MQIALLISGNLGYTMFRHCFEKFRPCFVATDSNSEGIINLAEEEAIPLFKGRPGNGKLYAFMQEHQPEVILSINYLFLIEQAVISTSRYAINFHGSLLPKYRGRTPHVWAVINNEQETGVTAHLIEEGCDTGPVVLQRQCPIAKEDTGNDILKKYEVLYPQMVDEILVLLKTGNLKPVLQDHSKATFFGKRTPEDGNINWSWQKERIRNWVRAQAYPYPGAFTSVNGCRITIDEVAYSDMGYDGGLPDGTLLATSPETVVKTPNGAIVLATIREHNIILQEGEKLGT